MQAVRRLIVQTNAPSLYIYVKRRPILVFLTPGQVTSPQKGRQTGNFWGKIPRARVKEDDESLSPEKDLLTIFSKYPKTYLLLSLKSGQEVNLYPKIPLISKSESTYFKNDIFSVLLVTLYHLLSIHSTSDLRYFEDGKKTERIKFDKPLDFGSHFNYHLYSSQSEQGGHTCNAHQVVVNPRIP